MSNSGARIAFVCSSVSWGGLEMNVLRYAQWIGEMGFSASVWCVEGSPLHKSAQTSSLPVFLIRRNRKYFDFMASRALSKALKAEGIDLVWIRDTRDIDTVGRATRISGVKLLYQQAMQLGVSKRDLFHTLRFNRIDAWISTLQFLEEQVKQMTRFPHERIAVIPLAYDADNLNNRPTQAMAREQFGIRTDLPVGALIGRIDPLKGHDFVLRMHEKVCASGNPFYLLIVGEPTLNEGEAYLAQLKGQVELSPFRHLVQFAPFRKDVGMVYAAADLVFMASAGETFGMVTIEAMACGVPVLGTNRSGTPEILDFGKAGILYEPNDEASFIAGLQLLLQEPTRVEFASIARARAEKYYSKEAVMMQLTQLINKLINRS